MKMENESERAGRVSNNYWDALKFDGWQREKDSFDYNMLWRLSLADIVAADGHKLVADLGSECGGMSYALREVGLRAISTEFLYNTCKNHLKELSPDVVHCDSFSLPLKKLDALVSYMFLGQNLPKQFRKGRSLKDIFGELAKSADTIYSVELLSEYPRVFSSKTMSQKDIEQKFMEELPDWEVKFLGYFGKYHRVDVGRGKFGDFQLEYEEIDRLGFKFTKKFAQAGLISGDKT